MNTTQVVTLSQTYYTVPPVVHAVQNDTGRVLKMFVADQTVPSGSTATLSIWRPDDTHYSINCEFVAADNAFTANITQALTQSGTVKCQLKVSGIVSTYTFNIDVQEDAGGTPTPQEGGSILDALETAQQAVTTANTANETSQAAKAKAEETVDFVDEMVTELNNGTYKSVLTGLSEQLLSSNRVIDQTPYLYRQTALGKANATRALMRKIVGGTVAWNQLCKSIATSTNGGVTLTALGDGKYKLQGTISGTQAFWNLNYVPNTQVLINGHIYAFVGANDQARLQVMTNIATVETASIDTIRKVTFDSSASYSLIRIHCSGNGNVIDTEITPQLFDLTQMFGSTIADYIYSLEQATAGSGIAKLKEWDFLTENYYPYDAGTLKSVEGVSAKGTVGKNSLQNTASTITQNGVTFTVESDGTVTVRGTATATAFFWFIIPKIPAGRYTLNGCPEGGGTSNYRAFIGKSSGELYKGIIDTGNGATFDIDDSYPSTGVGYGIRIASGYSANGLVFKPMIRFASVTNATYKPYEKHTYTVDSSLTLRGIPKLVNNELVYDGDEYQSDGTVTRNTILRVYQSGDEGLANAITDGTNTVVYSANASTETADPYTEVQVVDKDGTEEFITTGIVPVGHYTEYPEDLVGKLDSIPALPSANGRYVLQATVASGKVTYAWATA